jgi:hypothetical protein
VEEKVVALTVLLQMAQQTPVVAEEEKDLVVFLLML